jgi:hypothetical protein
MGVLGIFCFEKILGGLHGDIYFFNAIGGAHPRKGGTLEQLNKEPALAFAEAIDNFSKERKEKGWRGKAVLIHCSSIAAAILPDTEHGRVKQETDEALIGGNAYPSIDLVLCLRIGYIVESLLPGRRENPIEHNFGPDQLACLPAQPIIKGPIEQVIYPIYMKDVVDAVLNAPTRLYQVGKPNREVIPVIGVQAYTQEQFLKIFTDALSKPLIPFGVPVAKFSRIAEAFPLGHIAPYAAQYFMKTIPHAVLDTEPLKNLLGRELTPLDTITKEAKGNKDEILIRSPIMPYLFTIVENILTGKANLPATKDLIFLGGSMARAWMKGCN